MGTQTNIAEQIIQSEADYILSLKGNQKHLYEDVQDYFTGYYTCHRYETLEKDHGRIEKRTYTTLLTSEVFEADCIDGASDVFLKNLAHSYPPDGILDLRNLQQNKRSYCKNEFRNSSL